MTKEELKQRRERLGLTQADFAKILGVASNTVSRYETGLVDVPEWLELVLETLEQRQIKTLQAQVEK